MVNSYYPIYQAERGKTRGEIQAAEAQLGAVLAASVRAVRRSLRRQERP